MKPIWNALLISLSLLFPATTPALAEVSVTEDPLLTQTDTRSTLPSEADTPEADNSETQEDPTSASDADSESADSESADSESADSESADSESADSESADSESADSESADSESEESESATDPEEAERLAQRRHRLEVLEQADELYIAGDIAAAEALYREVKPSFSETGEQDAIASLPDATTESEQLSPAGQVYWREAQAGWEKNLESRIFVPLEFLVEESPEFIPGHLLLAQAHTKYEEPEKAVEVLERATTLYPDRPELIRAKVSALANTEKWLEASIAARQFAILNPEHPEVEEFVQLADDNFGKFRSHIRELIAGNAIGNVVTGAIGVALTGNPLGALSAVETLVMLARGESDIGESVANDAIEHLEMVEDEEVLSYVREMGHKLAKVTGRDDFEYEFYVIKDKNLNAFALPGGKIFVNAGAILHSDSEAELAGLITHELAHTVLSHGFQMVTHGNLLGSMTRYFPFGGTLTNLLVLDYSRDMERQADVLGTRLLTSAGYAADGLRNLMVKLKQEYGEGSSFWKFMSSHPPTKERITYLETLIERGGYNRLTYEGVERHQEVRQRVAELLRDRLSESELAKLDIELKDPEPEIEEAEANTEEDASAATETEAQTDEETSADSETEAQTDPETSAESESEIEVNEAENPVGEGAPTE